MFCLREITSLQKRPDMLVDSSEAASQDGPRRNGEYSTQASQNKNCEIIDVDARVHRHLERLPKILPGKHSWQGALAHKQKRSFRRQNPKYFSMSAKIGFTATTSKQKIYNIRIEQKYSLCCLPSRDRTAGLKISVSRCYCSYSLALFQLS
jgi:hypothetical protein